jgi:hypothetical protein
VKEVAMPRPNEEILRSQGLIAGEELPPEYSAFIEELSEEEIEVLVNVKQRLDDAGIPTATFKMAMPIF